MIVAVFLYFPEVATNFNLQQGNECHWEISCQLLILILHSCISKVHPGFLTWHNFLYLEIYQIEKWDMGHVCY